MPVETETKTVEKTKKTTHYVCDVDGCNNHSAYKEDLNFITINPHRDYIRTLPNQTQDALAWDSVIILCDEHTAVLKETIASIFDQEFHDGRGLVLSPVDGIDSLTFR